VLSGLHVLLAEDNPTNQLVATQMLENLGATVEVAADGVEALELVEAGRFDLLLVDIEMPRMNGIELIRRLRGSSGPISGLPMIALTAYVMREHIAAIDEAGADGVIAKPILSIERFGTEIAQHVARRRALDCGRPAGAPPGEGKPRVADGTAADIDRATYDGLAEIVGPAGMTDLLGKVEADLRAAATRLERAAGGPDIDEARSVSHILISVAGVIGAIRAQDLARDINRAAHAGDADAIRRAVPVLLAETGRVIDFVQAEGLELQA